MSVVVGDVFLYIDQRGYLIFYLGIEGKICRGERG